MHYETKIEGHRFVFRTWTYGMKQKALREATLWRRDADGLTPDVDPWKLNDMLLLQTLVEWDLKNGDGVLLPITLETIHGLQPPELVEEMIAYTQKVNRVSVEERKK